MDYIYLEVTLQFFGILSQQSYFLLSVGLWGKLVEKIKRKLRLREGMGQFSDQTKQIEQLPWASISLRVKWVH